MRKAKIDNCRDVLEVDIENFENMLEVVNAMKCILFISKYYRIDSDSNPLKYFSDGPQHILMVLCGPRTGLKSCPQGARTVGPDSHSTAGKNTFIML